MKTRSAYNPTSTTKGYWTLNGNSIDISGNTNTGNDTAITYPQGKFGQGAMFNGSTSNITHGVTGFPTGATSRTISLWFKPDALPTSGNSMVLNYWGANSTNKANGLNIVNNSGTMQVGYFGYANDYAENYNVRIGTWYHMTGTFDGTTARIFVNGYQVGAGSNKSTWNTTGANGIIGMLLGGSSKFQGTIDEVIVENRAWTTKEVETYYRKSVLNYKSSKSIWNIVYTYISQLSTGTFTLTGNTLTNLWHRISQLSTGVFSLVGNNIIVKRCYCIVLKTGSFILTGIDIIGSFTGWTNKSKSSSTWSNSTKNTSTFTNQTKNTSNWDNQNKS